MAVPLSGSTFHAIRPAGRYSEQAIIDGWLRTGDIGVMVVDGEGALVVNNPRIDLSARYGVLVFTLNNWSDFMEWLAALREQIPEEHKLAFAEAYARQ